MGNINDVDNWFTVTADAWRSRAVSTAVVMHPCALIGVRADRTDFTALPAAATGTRTWRPPIT